MRNNNSTFCGAEPTWANACVGDNGEPGYVEYSKGFSQAANLLIDQVLNNEGIDYPVDDFIYPVCFNMRHSVELRMKGAIEVLEKIAKLKCSEFSFNLSGSHDIKNIWSFFQVKSEKIDKRYTDINKNIESTILDIAEVDATGQTFRYPIDTESQKHLTDIAIINFVVLKRKFNELEEGLDLLHRLNLYLLEEYAQGSFTKKLSRLELFRIAQSLPQKKSWSEIDFNSIKATIRESYNLSSNDLTKGINIIKDHYEMAPIIGELPKLKGVSEEQIIMFLDEWIKLHEKVKHRSNGKSVLAGNDLKKLFNQLSSHDKLKSESWKIISKDLTPEFLAGLEALFYFARDKVFSESYVSTYENLLKEATIYFGCSESEVKRNFINLLDKTNAMNNMLISLYFLKRISFVERLIERYEVNESFSWLEKARSRELFEKPSFCGY